jgi:putative peptide zinc metalloprotease protein
MDLAASPKADDLPPLREELQLLLGPAAWDGSPTWLIHDPPAGRFVRIGWAEFEMLARWQIRSPVQLAKAVSEQTSLAVTPADVTAFCDQLRRTRLVGIPGADTSGLLKEYDTQRAQSLFMKLLKNYIFFRLPLVRPDPFLKRWVWAVSWIYSHLFLALTVAAAVLGILLATRQWDTFVGGFPYLLTGPGIISGLAALVLLKLLHELGHGFTARRYGCRARRAGIAFMFFVPMLFTDLTDAWRLTLRWQRVMIGAAGIVTELIVACWALLLWNFMPDGIVRSILFFWATAAWILTLLVNASPFLRFDGYYVLSDAIDQPNLHSAAFDMARWHLRRIVIGLNDPIPVRHTALRRRFLIGFGYATWVYRLLLFLGIAYILYLLPIKVAGIALAAVEIWWFILRPVVAELGVWWKRKAHLRMNASLLRSIFVTIAVTLVFVLPLRTSVHGIVMVAAESRTVILAPAAGQIESLYVDHGRAVQYGQMLAAISSPQLEYEVVRLRAEILNLDRLIEMSGRTDAMLQRVNVLVAERASRYEELRSAEAAISQLEIHAPFSGRIIEIVDRLQERDWIARGQPVFVLVDDGSLVADAFVSEQDLSRLTIGGRGKLFIGNDGRAPHRVTITEIDIFSTGELGHPMLSSVYGGPIPSSIDADGRVVPASPQYRVRVQTDSPFVGDRMQVGRIIFEGAAEGLAQRMFRHVIGVAVRETGF